MINLIKKIKRILTILNKLEQMEKEFDLYKDKVDIIDAWLENVEEITYESKKTFAN